MIYSNKIDYLLVLLGCFVAIYAQAGQDKNTIILVIGIVILMYGLFRISSSIKNKHSEDEDN